MSWFRTALGLLVDAVSVPMRHRQHSPRYLPLVGAWLVGAVRGRRLAAVPAAGLLPSPLAVHGVGTAGVGSPAPGSVPSPDRGPPPHEG